MLGQSSTSENSNLPSKTREPRIANKLHVVFFFGICEIKYNFREYLNNSTFIIPIATISKGKSQNST